MHLRQKARLRPELSPKFCQLWARTRPEKPGPTYNSDLRSQFNVDLKDNSIKFELQGSVTSTFL